DNDKATKDFDETAAYAGFGAQYDFGSFKVKADYQKLDTINQVNLGAVTTLAGWSVGAQYSINTDKSRTVEATKDVKATGYELFVNKEVLKNVYGYAEYGTTAVDEGKVYGSSEDSAAGFAVGLILVF
ncbi:porin, partial [Leptospira sp. SA-E8]|uniref:porin n=1 Tax=Leptospira sp. SA-E8 TaxID=3422259 RepID=UPI003EBCE435